MRILWQDQRGAALVYVTVMIGVLVGFAALAVDVGRITTTHTQARSAAEAAALAAASQLDGTGDAITRATNAAMTTPLVQNQQNLAQSPGTVTIAGLRFLSGLPDGTPVAILIAAILGVLLPVLDRTAPKRLKPWVPSASALGLAFVINGYNSVSMFIGALIALLLGWLFPRWTTRFWVTICAGVIAGESLTGAGDAVRHVILGAMHRE